MHRDTYILYLLTILTQILGTIGLVYIGFLLARIGG